MKSAVKVRVIQLRREGKSYGEIQKATGISKSTLSYWLKSIPVTAEQRKRFYTERIRNLARGPNSVRERRLREVAAVMESAKKEIKTPLSRGAYRLLGAALYWAEGTKKGLFEFTNSDPLLVYFMVQWTKDIFGISSARLKARLNIYSQQDDVQIRSFWSALCGIPLSNFGKSFIKPVSKGYKRNNSYYGTIKVTVPRSTDLKLRVFGWIEAALPNQNLRTRSIVRRWQHLKAIEKPVNLN